ncbi:hypothetical protein R1flu_029111 [Riccia fluitans]|uniref:Retrovirus-related Pol polyprotein from transposon TNT 1-94 n=1 Tax=Riccia fluitans TaxID=41844 RepID=A0ABD1XNK6_9MARC
MIVRTLDPSHDVLGPRPDTKQVLGSEYPYMAAIGILMYLANTTCLDITFLVNLLARYSHEPTKRHWTSIKQLFRYLVGIEDMGLFFTGYGNHLVGYADVGFMSDPHKGHSQTSYVFLLEGNAISWHSIKQTIVATSSNHGENFALHEASRKCVWLRALREHIQLSCGLEKYNESSILYEDNAACVHQIQKGYIKGDCMKHIAPKFFFTSELHGKEIAIQAINSCNNLADIFTKSLPASMHWKILPKLGLRQLHKLRSVEQGENSSSHHR